MVRAWASRSFTVVSLLSRFVKYNYGSLIRGTVKQVV